MRTAPAMAAALAVAGTAAPAHASLFWSFAFNDGSNIASGTLTTNPLSAGVYGVTGITGTYDGSTITGLAPTGLGPYSASDNDLLPAPSFLDYGGLGFTLSSGGPEVLYSPEGGFFFEYDQGTGDAGGFASFTATQLIPEPASTGLFAAALATVAMLRRRR